MNQPDTARNQVSLAAAVSIVVASMVGTGVFTSLGFQVGPLPSGFVLLALWFVGGVCALCGALSYGELAAAMPRSGGEYYYLSRIYHPAVGFLSGWISATVGFAAPTALSAWLMMDYLNRVVPVPHPRLAAMLAVLAIGLVHLTTLRAGGLFQTVSTALKVALILGVALCGLVLTPAQELSFLPRAGDGRLLVSGSFAVSLVYVMYSYSGWNTAAYIAGELRQPARTVPLALALGTAVVMALYLLLNFVFLRVSPLDELAGVVDVAYPPAVRIFGPVGAQLMSLLIAFGLISMISSMLWAGPRVMQAMGEDLPLFGLLARTNARGIPVAAIVFQLAVVLLMLAASTFDAAIAYLGFTLTLSSMLTVLGVFVLRLRRPDLPRPYKTWGYPVTPLIFLAVSGWMCVFLAREQPLVVLVSLATIALGLLIYAVTARYQRSVKP